MEIPELEIRAGAAIQELLEQREVLGGRAARKASDLAWTLIETDRLKAEVKLLEKTIKAHEVTIKFLSDDNEQYRCELAEALNMLPAAAVEGTAEDFNR